MSTEKPNKRALLDAAIAAGKRATASPVDEAKVIQAAEVRAETQVSAALLGKTVQVGNFKIRPFTLSSIALLKEIDSPLILGVAVDSVPNIILDVLRLIVLQTRPLPEAVALAENREALTLEAYALGDTVAPHETEELVAATLGVLRDATSNQVTASVPESRKAKKGGKDAEEGNDSSRLG